MQQYWISIKRILNVCCAETTGMIECLANMSRQPWLHSSPTSLCCFFSFHGAIHNHSDNIGIETLMHMNMYAINFLQVPFQCFCCCWLLPWKVFYSFDTYFIWVATLPLGAVKFSSTHTTKIYHTYISHIIIIIIIAWQANFAHHITLLINTIGISLR